ISRSTVIGEAQRQGKTIFQTDPAHKVTEQYRKLAHELEQRLVAFAMMPIEGQEAPQPADEREGARVHGNRSGSENLTLAIPSPHSIPCRHGNPAGITTRGVGMDPTRGASLYSGAGSACRDLDIHGPRLTGAGWHVAGTAAPDVTEFFPPPIERSATASTSTSPAGATPSWRSTGPSWLYAHPDTCGRSR